MGDINLKAALGGQIVLTPTNTASNYTITMPAATGTALLSGATNPAGNLTLTTPSTNTASYAYWNNGSINVAAVAGYSDSATAGHLEFYTTTGSTLTERVRIDSSGNFGIGTATPGTKLDVNGGIKFASSSWVYAGSDQTFYSDSSYGLIIKAPATSNFIAFRSSDDTERMRILGTGNILSLAGASTTATGTGIAFPATQSASSDVNTLDDYEEGTWTPSVGGTATYGTRNATYTKIGDTVRCYFDITITSIGTGSVGTLSGFPFSSSYNDAGCISYWSGLATSVLSISIQMSSATCLFIGATTSGTACVNGFSIFGNSARIIGTVVYKTST